MRKIIYIFIIFCFISACDVELQKQSDDTLKKQSVAKDKNKTEQTSELQEISKPQKQNNEQLSADTEGTKTITKADCSKVNTDDKTLLESQTFPFDFTPFKGSCFVTKHNSQYDDPPLGTEFSLYNEGNEIYKFDSRFNSNSATCFVEAVAFEDLNKDNLQDIIIVGKCGAKSGELIANEVFMNTGKGTFYTSPQTNDKLEEFTKIKDVSNFVKKNKDIFFK